MSEPEFFLCKEDKTLEPAEYLTDLLTQDRSCLRLALRNTIQEFHYPGAFPCVEKVVISPDPKEMKVSFQVSTDLQDLLAVTDPKYTSPAAMTELRKYHERQVIDDFLHHIFRQGYVVLPADQIITALTSRDKVFIFYNGSVWDATHNHTLVPVADPPKQRLKDLRFGSHELSVGKFTFISHAVYSRDIKFEK